MHVCSERPNSVRIFDKFDLQNLSVINLIYKYSQIRSKSVRIFDKFDLQIRSIFPNLCVFLINLMYKYAQVNEVH